MKKQKKDGKSWRILIYFGLSILAALGVILLARGIRVLMLPNCSDEAGVIVSAVEGLVACIAAGLVLYQLQIGDESTRHQTKVEQAEFILEYNRSFIENEKMTEMERYMECMLTGVDRGSVNTMVAHRQDMINYLVYLEGLASCVHQEVLKLEEMDDLFAYRFFLAMNHPEVQSIDLIPYATYYRGCFLLYEKWLNYRMGCGKYDEKANWDIPLYDSALCNCYGYEKYVMPELKLDTNLEKKRVEASISGKPVAVLSWECDCAVRNVKVEKQGKKPVPDKVIRAMLKELIYMELKDKDGETNPTKPITEVRGDSNLKKEFERLIKTKNILYREGVHFRQLNNKLKITDANLKRIAGLIYDTDDYIYPHMFGRRENAEIVIPQLLRGNKDIMFSLDNLFVCEWCEEIIGIILWYEGALEWSSEELCSAMEKEKIEPPDKLDDVQKEYMSGYNAGSKNGVISILNVCLAPKARGQKIAPKMLLAFMEEHKEADMELCVLSDNDDAIELYEKCGFTKVREEKAYPKNMENHMRYLMERKNAPSAQSEDPEDEKKEKAT